MKPTLRLFTLFLLGTAAARADITLAPLFTDHAVLQRDKPVPVWGQADAGEKVSVTFAGQVVNATTGADGRWIVMLAPLTTAAQGADLTATGKNTLVAHDVVVGEVWLCSGQSNMEFAVNRAANGAQEVATANFPLLRHITVSRAVAEAPAASAKTTGWKAATPTNAGAFSAVGYFFAHDLHRKLGVPFGVVHSSWGGTWIESWLSPAALAGDPAFRAVGERWQQMLAEYPAKQTAYDTWFAEWSRAETEAKANGAAAHAAFQKQRPRQSPPRGPGNSWTPTGLFNGMINPLVPYGLRGVLWYQGESNTDRAAEYQALFTAMITAWRGHFGQSDLAFYWVNLANFKATYEARPDNWPWLREAQTRTLALPHTGQAIAIDLGHPDDIHPTNKQEVGRRLALLARRRVYGFTGDDTGPTFASATREGAALRVQFIHASGLVAHDKPVQSLEVAGADRVFHPATARIEGETLLVSSPAVKSPVAVRYAWKNCPEANLHNGAGLPAVPFRSDAW